MTCNNAIKDKHHHLDFCYAFLFKDNSTCQDNRTLCNFASICTPSITLLKLKVLWFFNFFYINLLLPYQCLDNSSKISMEMETKHTFTLLMLRLFKYRILFYFSFFCLFGWMIQMRKKFKKPCLSTWVCGCMVLNADT